MRPQIHGESRWSGWRLKMLNCHSSCRGQWRQRQRRPVRPERRWVLLPHITNVCLNLLYSKIKYSTFNVQFVLSHPNIMVCDNVGYCSRGWDECIQSSEGGVSGDLRVSIRPSAQIPPNPQHHRSREELHHHLPSTHGHHKPLHEEMIAEYSQSVQMLASHSFRNCTWFSSYSSCFSCHLSFTRKSDKVYKWFIYNKIQYQYHILEHISTCNNFQMPILYYIQ